MTSQVSALMVWLIVRFLLHSLHNYSAIWNVHGSWILLFITLGHAREKQAWERGKHKAYRQEHMSSVLLRGYN